MSDSRIHSIMQADMSKCYICGTTQNLHTHEVFFGSADRKKSIKWGCYVKLCARHHNMSNEGVHFNKQLNYQLKKKCQTAFEEKYSHEQFMKIFRKNYL